MVKKIVIIGAGPAGLTAGYELLRKGFEVTILEESLDIGGISKTVNHNGNRIDIGGHRFFSKIDKVNSWWQEILKDDLLKRDRRSRILYQRKLYDYPISLNQNTIKNLGLKKIFKIGLSYLRSRIIKKEEKNLEDFFINRFGKELYQTFFKDYTQKVWGVPCTKIDALFGHQRIKGLSVTKVLIHGLKKLFVKDKISKTETSLIEEFSYPKFGPGQLWEKAALKIKEMGGNIIFEEKAIKINHKNGKICSVSTEAGNEYGCDILLSSMPVRDIIEAIGESVAKNIKDIAGRLEYRDFIIAGLLLERIKINGLDDNWIYIQEPDVKMGRLQIFNNWSPFLVNDSSKIWLGLEYFCQENDDMWDMSEESFLSLAIGEMEKLGFIDRDDVIDKVRIKVKKAYPSYFGSYNRFDEVKEYLNTFDNLFCIGRNGQHRYNNMDHSMMTAFEAVDVILNGGQKHRLWSVNTEKEYHESNDK